MKMMVGPASLFTSNRERRLWLLTLAAIVAIYASLGAARTLADALRERNFLEVSFALVVVVLVGATTASWIRSRPGWSDIGVALGVALAYLGMFLRMGTPEERTHLIEYGIVAALIHMALLERAENGRRVPLPAALTVALTAAFGFIDELIQAVLPSRVFDFRDVFFNALAGFMMTAARLAIAPQRSVGWRVWFLWLMAAALGWGQGTYWGWFDGTEPTILESTPPDVAAGFAGLTVGAMLSSLLQWLVLKRHVARADQWIMSTVAALALVGAITFGVGLIETDLGWLAGVASFGPVIGVVQWAVLRPHVYQAGWWMLASAGAWALSMPLGDIAGPPALGAFYGATTGAVMVWLLRHPRKERSLERRTQTGTSDSRSGRLRRA